MRTRIIILLALVVLILLGVGSCRKAGTWLVKQDEPVHADALVLLMGSFSERVLQTADLYHAKVSGRVCMVEAGMGARRMLEERGVRIVSNSTQARNALVSLGVPADSIRILPGDATSTLMEAVAVRDYLETRSDMDTLLLVTSADHGRRAVKIFEAACANLPHLVTVLCSPNPYSDFNARRWWRNRDDIEEVLKEYLKLIDFCLFERRELRRG